MLTFWAPDALSLLMIFFTDSFVLMKVMSGEEIAANIETNVCNLLAIRQTFTFKLLKPTTN